MQKEQNAKRETSGSDEQTITEQQPDSYPRLRRFGRKVLRLMAAGTIGTVLLTEGTAAGSYLYLKNETEHCVAEYPEVTINEIGTSHENEKSNVGIYVLPGLGLHDADPVTEKLAPALSQEGRAFSIGYSDQDFGFQGAAQTIVEHAHTNGIDEIILETFSMGGKGGADIGAYIYTNHPDLTVRAIIMNSTPIGAESTMPNKRQQGDIMMEAVKYGKKIGLNLECSRTLHLGLEMGMRDRRERILNDDDRRARFFHEIEDARRTRVDNPHQANGRLYLLQYSYVTTHNIDGSLRDLGREYPDRNKPILVYTRAVRPEDDEVVDIVYSTHKITNAAIKNDSPYILWTIPDIGHANAMDRPEEYKQAFLDIMDYVHSVEEQRRYRQLKLGPTLGIQSVQAMELPPQESPLVPPPPEVPATLRPAG